MRTLEFVIPVPYEQARQRFSGQATFLRRSKIDDIYFENGAGAVVRLRRQDSISRLSCAKWSDQEPSAQFETIVLDFTAARGLVELLGFKQCERLAITRDSWKKHHYSLHLDRIDGLGQFLTVEAPPASGDRRQLILSALKLLKQMGISVRSGLKKALIDKKAAVPYTALCS